MTSTLTITRALAELKTLEKRISKLTNSTTFVSFRVTGRRWEDHVDETKSNYQSLSDLIARYNRIKNAVIHSNATTKVTISGTKYTVAEAISRKNTINYEQQLLETMRQQRTDTRNQISWYEKEVQTKLDSLLEKSFSRDKKTSDTEIKTITEAFLNANSAEEVDPLGIDDEIKRMEASIDDFLKEVDFVLSEANAMNTVEV